MYILHLRTQRVVGTPVSNGEGSIPACSNTRPVLAIAAAAAAAPDVIGAPPPAQPRPEAPQRRPAARGWRSAAEANAEDGEVQEGLHEGADRRCRRRASAVRQPGGRASASGAARLRLAGGATAGRRIPACLVCPAHRAATHRGVPAWCAVTKTDPAAGACQAGALPPEAVFEGTHPFRRQAPRERPADMETSGRGFVCSLSHCPPPARSGASARR
eukprot:SAG22_NODE_37_length_26837_cov_8.103523_9_plen_216_part_00